MVVLLFLWVILVLSLPKISPMIAEIIYPVKSSQVEKLEENLIRQSVEHEMDANLRQLYDNTMTEFGFAGSGISVPGRTDAEQRAQESYDSQKRPIVDGYQRKISEEIRKLREDYENRRATQATISMNLSRISPVSCYTYVTSEVSLTGVLEMNNLLQNASRFQSEVNEDVYDKYTVRSYGGTKGGTATMIQEVPGFNPKTAPVPQMHYDFLSLASTLRAEWVDILLLVLFNLAFFAGSYVSFNRYDVR